MTKQNLMNRRMKALELKTMGHTVRAIAEQLNVSSTTAHNDIDVLLRDMAEKDTGRANNNRMLLNERYEALIRAYLSKATGGDTEAAKLVIDILFKQAKINGLIPKEPLLNINQINPPPIENFTFHIERANLGGDIDESEWEPAITIQ
tara:strand:- start:281 stop:724 length:444 start_codon:yes stop_codon:yes gene_type:complete